MHPTIPAPLGPFLRRVGPRAGLGRRPSASRRSRRRRRGGERPCRIFARCGKGEKGGRLSRCFPNLGGDPVPRRAAGAGMAGMPPLAPDERDNLGVTPGPPCGFGGGGWVPLVTPPALAPLQSRIVPGSAGGGGAGPRASGKAGGKAGAGTCWSRLSCWWSCSSRLPVCPCSSPAARAGCIPRGRSRPALPWRGAAWGPTSASRAPAADVVLAGCCLRAAGSAPCGITCPEPPGTCGEYGCDLSCNHGGCQEVARVCPVGFSMAETANGVRCTDIDECQSAACEGTCVNTEGGFACECGAGRELSADRRSCRDTDECQATPCQHRCENSVGSYRCSCRPGYHLHGNRHSCVDVDECRRPGTRRSCQHSCHNIPGSFRCSCRPGYRLSADRVSCEGYPKSILAPSPILQSLQHPPTLVLLPPGSHLLPRGSPSPHLPVAAPGTQLPPSSPSLSPEPSPRAMGAPGTSIPPSHHCWHWGISREPGSRWTEPGCQSCTCQGGRVLCDTVSCSVPCSHPLPAPAGGCCPTCTGCLHEGVARAEGDVFSPSDGNCTVCVCLAGNISCLSPECPPGSCPSSSPSDCCSCNPEKCNFRGRTYAHGARFSLDGDDCTTCVCQGGEVECSFTPCPVLDCPQHQRQLGPGQCCSTCRDPPAPAGCFLDDNGVEFPVGQIWSPGDPCELCICQADGSVSCQRTDCVETCPYPIRIPGQCCPDCSAGCTYMGRIFSNNETFPSALDPCLSCICLLGSVACSPLECAIVCSYPFHPEGRCCPVCEDCNYQGRKVENGQSFVPEGQPCTRCTCQLGEVSCEERPCPSSCSEPHTLPVGCCPSCPATDIRLLLQGNDLSPSSSPSSSQSSSQSSSSPPFSSQSPVPEDSPPGTPQHRRYRLAQLLLPTTPPLGPSPGIWGAGMPPPSTPSPSGYPLAPTVPPDPLCETTAPPDPTGSPEVQGSPRNEDPSAVPSDSPGFQVPGVPGTP
ncbi:von Willebrand factor C and EGF domain-containing protein isoform X2 [Motacilla alba alba]|uniref:von Willebrand factor C and EGF domain-containing protein isoform X2 n=1 Tax=Motacilla alba alba TaxID=1094192 RepID=UPI0018D4EA83|nr:von Willebrand factor C and EGF domain-containing protein isoform X2 [Motacilla alba alba]